ncbi:MAG: hypothetical protein R3B93_11640 [Bacteroidia bacterium]
MNKDGNIYLSELQKYLFFQVPLLTGNKQQPTTRMENIAFDWRIW